METRYPTQEDAERRGFPNATSGVDCLTDLNIAVTVPDETAVRQFLHVQND